MEFACLGEIFFPQVPGIAHCGGKVKISPDPARERLQFVMGIGIPIAPLIRPHMSSVVKDRGILRFAVDKFRHFSLPFVDCFLIKFQPVPAVQRIVSVLFHQLSAGRTCTGHGKNNVQKQSVDYLKCIQNLFHMLFQKFPITGIQAQRLVKACLKRLLLPAGLTD